MRCNGAPKEPLSGHQASAQHEGNKSAMEMAVLLQRWKFNRKMHILQAPAGI